VHEGSFYALPQSPQIYKQILMVSGFDRYFQLARCFRDEDLRADRQPEFTQIDIEASFVSERDVMDLTEKMLVQLFADVLGVTLAKFPVLTWDDAMSRYGSDKPDLRNPLELTDIADLMQDVEFNVFKGPANDPKGRVVALRAPGGSSLSRKVIDDYTDFVARYGAKGLAYIKVNEKARGIEGLQSPILKFLSHDIAHQILERCGAQDGDLIFFGADRAAIVNDSLGALRQKIGLDLGLIEEGWRPLWVVDFPMFEYDEEGKQWAARHHPFTSPKDGHEEYIESNPGKAYSKAYDMVLNGWEIGGGSVRIHRPEVQEKVFRALQISPEDQRAKFGFLLDSLQWGAPPHGGIAFGLDRIVTLMCGAESIRDVIAFPKTQRGQDMVTGAPSRVADKQLRELHVRLRNPESTDKRPNSG